MRCDIKQRWQPSQKSLENHAEADIQKKIKNIHDDLRYQTRVTTITEIMEESFKTFQKTFKNQPKTIENQSQIYENQLLGPLEAHEAPRPPQDPSNPENREEYRHPPGHHFGRILEPCWPQEPLKGHSKSIQNFHWFGSPSFIDFSSILAGFWEDLGAKLASKIH